MDPQSSINSNPQTEVGLCQAYMWTETGVEGEVLGGSQWLGHQTTFADLELLLTNRQLRPIS